MDGNGIIQKVAGEELNTFRVNLGLLGIILEATFKVVPAFKLAMEVQTYPDTILNDETLIHLAYEYDYFAAQWWPDSNEV